MDSDWQWTDEVRDNSWIVNDTNNNSNNYQLYIKAYETIKFIALSIDVNNGQRSLKKGVDSVFYSDLHFKSWFPL